MRKRYRVLVLAVIAAALVVPFGFALSLETGPASTHTPHALVNATAAEMTSAARPVAAVRIRTAAPGPTRLPAPMNEGVLLFVVGAVLCGAAAVLKRSV